MNSMPAPKKTAVRKRAATGTAKTSKAAAKVLNGRTRKDPTDIHVGRQLRQRRNELGFSQERLAGMVGVSFQQVQKYENGVNRVSMGRIKDLATALEVPFGYFFDGLPGTEELVMPTTLVAEDTPAGLDDSQLTGPESIALLKAYHALDEADRAKVLALVQKLLAAQ